MQCWWLCGCSPNRKIAINIFSGTSTKKIIIFKRDILTARYIGSMINEDLLLKLYCQKKWISIKLNRLLFLLSRIFKIIFWEAPKVYYVFSFFSYLRKLILSSLNGQINHLEICHFYILLLRRK